MYKTAEGGRCVFVKFTACDGPAAFFTKARRHNNTTTTSRVEKGRTSFSKSVSSCATHTHPQDETERKTDRHQVRPSSSDSARCEKQPKEIIIRISTKKSRENETEKEIVASETASEF
jgi:hypothetical protein